MAIVTPTNDQERVTALKAYSILDSLPEPGYDDIAELAAQICGCPAGLVSFVDESRQWIKAKYGLPPDLTECPREISVCGATICGDDVLYVPDLTQDSRFNTSPLVTGDFALRFYCGAPLINQEGYALGTLCVVDFAPKEITFAQQEALRRLSRQAMTHLELRRKLLEHSEVMRELAQARDAAVSEQAASDRLLLNILPSAVAEELKAKQRVQPRFYDSASVMFVDFREFTRLIEALEPARVIEQLHQHFAKFDEIVAHHRLEKLKTIGDAFLAVGGVPEPNRTHALDACLAALEMADHLAKTNRQREKLRLPLWEARIGINTGPVIAGVVGKHKFAYDIWGNTVNVAERVESAGAPGRVTIAEATWHRVKSRFETESRGSVEVKHKGSVSMYYVNRILPEFASDPAGLVPNDRFWSPDAEFNPA
ncbi:MAG TPA: adenylate/guanylate cyclase domain-containing protein [Alphaproteobacteria bacterium]|jgi:class 3 adenylate cyclase